jgi:mannitol/fructose-specific phosphotransferase system IIA component (Ntr-type)
MFKGSSNECMESMEEKIEKMCDKMGEYNYVRYRSEFEKNVELEKLVKKKLDE